MLQRLRDANSRVKSAHERYMAAMGEYTLALGAQQEARQCVWTAAAASESGTRGAQDAMMRASSDGDRVLLAEGLEGHVNEAWQSRYANFFLEKCIQMLRIDQVTFIVQELLGVAPGSTDGTLQVDLAATHAYGVRVLQRLVEYQPLASAKVEALLAMEALLARIVQRTPLLVNDKIGNLLLKSLLEHGSDEIKKLVVQQMMPNVVDIAQQKYGSYVVQHALRYCPLPDMVRSLQDSTRILAQTFTGSFVHRTLREVLRSSYIESPL